MAQDGPIRIEGEEEILICRCMQSNHWPFCDASHHSLSGSSQTPELLTLDKNKTYFLCGCFRSKNKPFCDGSHDKISRPKF